MNDGGSTKAWPWLLKRSIKFKDFVLILNLGLQTNYKTCLGLRLPAAEGKQNHDRVRKEEGKGP